MKDNTDINHYSVSIEMMCGQHGNLQAIYDFVDMNYLYRSVAPKLQTLVKNLSPLWDKPTPKK